MTPRTESKTVTVTLDQEKELIQNMELFGWYIQSREDVTPLVPADPKATTSIKLHFVRRLDLPNLDEIKDLESQYPFGELPEEYRGGCLTDILAMALGRGGPLLILIGIALLFVEQISKAIAIGVIVLGIISGLVGISWERNLDKKEHEASKGRQEIISKRQEIKKKLESLGRQE